MFRPNDKISPYTLVSRIGRGSFGVVWLAEKRGAITTTKFALKMPLDDDIDLEAVIAEASVWVQASGHPNVVPIIEADAYDEQIVIVSEYAPDGSLENWLHRHSGKAPSIEVAVKMIDGILAELEHLHKRKIIHRDLKPANILLQGDTPRLADFGIARVLKTAHSTTVVAGTPLYMAPEAWKGARTEQTDLWAAGVIFYKLLSGAFPFDRSDMYSLIDEIKANEPTPLPKSIPASLREVLANALEKNPSQRYATIGAMRKAIQKAIQPDSTHRIPLKQTSEPSAIPKPRSKPQIIPQSPKPNPQPQPAPISYLPLVPEPQPKPAKRLNRKVARIIVALLIVIIGVLGFVKFNSDRIAKVQKSLVDLQHSFVQIPAGEFMMGGAQHNKDEQPIHKVKFTRSFEIGKYEITQVQWEAAMGSHPNELIAYWEYFTGANFPVESVSWEDVQEFITKLNAKNDGYIYRLPTESEWEYACRAGTTEDYAGNLDQMGWYNGNSGSKTHSIGQKKPNGWGLYDMHGNVWEWCNDVYDNRYYANSSGADPKGPESGSPRVLRGGGYNNINQDCRSANRDYNTPNARSDGYGFRLVRTLR